MALPPIEIMSPRVPELEVTSSLVLPTAEPTINYGKATSRRGSNSPSPTVDASPRLGAGASPTQRAPPKMKRRVSLSNEVTFLGATYQPGLGSDGAIPTLYGAVDSVNGSCRGELSTLSVEPTVKKGKGQRPSACSNTSIRGTLAPPTRLRSASESRICSAASRARRWTIGIEEGLKTPPALQATTLGASSQSVCASSQSVSSSSSTSSRLSLVTSESIKSLTTSAPSRRRKSCAGELLYKCDKLRNSERNMFGLMDEIGNILSKMNTDDPWGPRFD